MLPFPWRKMPPPPPEPPPRVPAALAAMEREFLDRPFGGYGGERLIPPPATPQAQPQPVFSPPPPDWASEGLDIVMPAPAPPEEPRGLEIEAPPWSTGFVPGPPLQLPPLERPQFPAPNWREEERERAAQERAEKALEIDEQEPERYPAKRRAKGE